MRHRKGKVFRMIDTKYIEKAHQIVDNEDELFIKKYIEKLNYTGAEMLNLRDEAVNVRRKVVGDKLFIRGSLEYSNICSNSCAFCGMAETNKSLARYELSFDEVKSAIEVAKSYGITQLHIVSGENKDINIEKMCMIVEYAVSEGLAVTLVLGELEKEMYESLYRAGARRYILKFESSNANVYNASKGGKSLYERIGNLLLLRDIGYKVGTGIISGLPGTTDRDLARDLMVLKRISPDMASVSVFSPNESSLFCAEKSGNVAKTLNFVALMRSVLSTTEIITCSSSFAPNFRFDALNAGANLLSLHITPKAVAKDFSMYTDKNRVMTQYDYIYECAKKGNLQIAEYK